MEGQDKNTETLEEEIARLKKEKEMLEEAHRLLIEENEELVKKAYFDRLTGMMSRLAFDEEMERRSPYIFKKHYDPERRETEGEKQENIVLAIFDIDKFKSVNDTFGHEAGDVVLREVAQTILFYTRKTDMVARWGGEEMVVSFDGATLEGAELKANFIRQKISEIVFNKFPNLRVTISAGLANSTEFGDMNSFFKAADEALYQSKNTGRNKVTVHKE